MTVSNQDRVAFLEERMNNDWRGYEGSSGLLLVFCFFIVVVTKTVHRAAAHFHFPLRFPGQHEP